MDLITQETREQLAKAMHTAAVKQSGNHAWKDANQAFYLAAADAAIAFLAPVLLREPSTEEEVATWNECASTPLDRTDWPFLIKRLLSNRLAAATSKPDAVVKAVEQIICEMVDVRLAAEQVVAKVRELDAKA